MTPQQLNWHIPDNHEVMLCCYHDTPAGQLLLRMQGKILCHMQWLTSRSSRLIPMTLPEQYQKQINALWLGSEANMILPLLRQGTPFQHQVWALLRQIPVGQTCTYGELASELNTSPRALANACRSNPFPLIIPCHRVVAKSGIGGYAGEVTGKLIDIKKTLLQYEKMIAHDI